MPIIIERDDETDAGVITSAPTPQRGGRFKKIALALLLALGCISVVVGYKVWAYYYGIAIPISVTPSENIEKLVAPKVNEPAFVAMTSDSILGPRHSLRYSRSCRLSTQKAGRNDAMVGVPKAINAHLFNKLQVSCRFEL